MQTLQYTYDDVDKREWGEGPWVDEHDKVQWLDEETGLPCIIKRNKMGAWCGYVGVSEGHPAFEKENTLDDDLDLEVHGGITFTGFCQEHGEGEQEEAHAICHVVENGENDRVWWLGFDCGHAWDTMPMYEANNRKRYEETGNEIWNTLANPRDTTYKTQEYVTNEVRELARQLAKEGR